MVSNKVVNTALVAAISFSISGALAVPARHRPGAAVAKRQNQPSDPASWPNWPNPWPSQSTQNQGQQNQQTPQNPWTDQTGQLNGLPANQQGQQGQPGQAGQQFPGQTGQWNGQLPSQVSGLVLGQLPGQTGNPATTQSTAPAPVQTGGQSAGGFTPVVGITGACNVRPDINTLQQSDPDMFNMLILAWERLAGMPEDATWGYFQIAGIHGAPYVPWQMDSPPIGNWDTTRGYCTHGSSLFATWHRPYLLAMEQALFEQAAAIANEFPEARRGQYQAAAGRVRLPFWDWTAGDGGLPAIVMQQSVSVTRPNGNGAEQIPNPLFSYRFQSQQSISSFRDPLNRIQNTVRQPDPASFSDRSNIASTNMQAGSSSRLEQIRNLFSATSFNFFVNRVEGIHDGVHGALGGGGHIGIINYSSFDPVFWLHHCNVDRLLSLFQATRPELWLEATNAVGTFARPVTNGDIDDTNTQLYPFRRGDGNWWTSTNTQGADSTFGMGYGYPEVRCPAGNSQKRQDIGTYAAEQINKLYGGTRVVGSSCDWQARVLIDQAEIPGGFDIHVYGGDRPADAHAQVYREGYIGSLTSMPMGAENIAKPSRVRYVDVNLNAFLKSCGMYGNDGGDTTKITNYLKDKIYYTIVANGKPCSLDNLKTAKIGVYSRGVEDSGQSTSLPQYMTQPNFHVNVTQGMSCGAKTIEDMTNPIDINGNRAPSWVNEGESGFSSQIPQTPVVQQPVPSPSPQYPESGAFKDTNVQPSTEYQNVPQTGNYNAGGYTGSQTAQWQSKPAGGDVQNGGYSGQNVPAGGYQYDGNTSGGYGTGYDY